MPGPSIVTLTMNPALDISSAVEKVLPAHKLRCGPVRDDPGGGGINVARAIHRLNGTALAIFPAGGSPGEKLCRLLATEGVPYIAVPIAGETRQDFAITESATGAQYRFVLPGPELTAAECQACLDTLAANIGDAKFVVASGSLPPGVPRDFYVQVTRVVAAAGACFVLDTSGAALDTALRSKSGIHLIKPSLRELSALTGRPIAGRADGAAVAREIVESGAASYVAVTLGEDGAILVSTDGVLSARAPALTPKSSVGAGDSFLGALIWAMAQEKPLQEALRLAVAAGSATLLAPGTELFRPEEMARLSLPIAVDDGARDLRQINAA